MCSSDGGWRGVSHSNRLLNTAENELVDNWASGQVGERSSTPARPENECSGDYQKLGRCC